MITRTDTVYICEHCGAEYASSADATECENNHKLTLTVSQKVYKPINEVPNGFPKRLYVTSGTATKKYALTETED